MYILAGKEAPGQGPDRRRWSELRKKAAESGAQEDAQAYNDLCQPVLPL